MSPTFERDWSNLREQDHVDLYLTGEDTPNWDDVTVTWVDDDGRYLKVWRAQGGYPHETLQRDKYDVTLL